MSKQFIAKAFKEEAKQYGIKLIYGKPYHLRGRDKIEGYHKALYRELISVDRFSSHFREESRKFDKRYNERRHPRLCNFRF